MTCHVVIVNMFLPQIDRQLFKKPKQDEEGTGETEDSIKDGENSVELMVRLTKHIYNYQGVDSQGWVWSHVGNSCVVKIRLRV